MTTVLRCPLCYQITRVARAPAMCRAVQRDTKAKGHIDGVPGAGRSRPCHPTPLGPSEERRRRQRDPGAAARRGGRRPRPPSHAATEPGHRPDSTAGTWAAPAVRAAALGPGPGSPCKTLGPDPGTGDGLATISRLPARARPDRRSLGGHGSAVMHRERTIPLAPAAPSAGPTHQHRPLSLARHRRRRHPGPAPGPLPARTAQQRLIGQRRYPLPSAGAGRHVRYGGAVGQAPPPPHPHPHPEPGVVARWV